MTDRSDLVREINQAQGGAGLARAVAALDLHDRQRREAAAADRELDLAADFAAQRLTPVSLHEHHTAATDWLIDADEAGHALDYRTAMYAEASTWYGNLDLAVRADAGELAEQARGRARTLASAYASKAPAAESEFLRVVGYLRATDAASGLPQIDQTVDPNNQPSATPYPTDVFPTFGEEQDAFNGVETNSHGSGAASDRAPMLQQLNQQDGSGSGFGSGPEKQLTHDTGFGTADSYAEVPLGTPGQIPTTPAATDRQAGSAPTPLQGQPQDAGSEHRQTVAAIQGYSMPDPFGYRWATTPEIVHPFHERCGSAHWPDEDCGDRTHTASVAISYSMTLDAARKVAGCERIGAQEGLRAWNTAATLSDLADHHNRITAAWGASERTLEDTAVLHGFMAVVRPVLADLAPVTARACGACASGNCQNCSGDGCSCSKCHRKKQASLAPATARYFTQKQREQATEEGDAIHGKLPIKNEQDLENAEHLKGKVKGIPKSEVDAYMERKEKEFGHKESSADAGRLPNFT